MSGSTASSLLYRCLVHENNAAKKTTALIHDDNFIKIIDRRNDSFFHDDDKPTNNNLYQSKKRRSNGEELEVKDIRQLKRAKLTLTFKDMSETQRKTLIQHILEPKAENFYENLYYVNDHHVFHDIVTCPEFLNYKDGNGTPVLHGLITNQNVSLFNIFLQNGADVHAFDNKHNTCLHVACLLDEPLSWILQLINFGADPSSLNNRKQTPLHVLLCNPQLENTNVQDILKCVEILLLILVLPNRDVEGLGSRNRDSTEFRRNRKGIIPISSSQQQPKGNPLNSVNNNNNVRAKILRTKDTIHKLTPLLCLKFTLFGRRFERAFHLAEALLSYGACPNEQDKLGHTLLSYSVSYLDDSFHLSRLLVNYGATIYATNLMLIPQKPEIHEKQDYNEHDHSAKTHDRRGKENHHHHHSLITGNNPYGSKKQRTVGMDNTVLVPSVKYLLNNVHHLLGINEKLFTSRDFSTRLKVTNGCKNQFVFGRFDLWEKILLGGGNGKEHHRKGDPCSRQIGTRHFLDFNKKTKTPILNSLNRIRLKLLQRSMVRLSSKKRRKDTAPYNRRLPSNLTSLFKHKNRLLPLPLPSPLLKPYVLYREYCQSCATFAVLDQHELGEENCSYPYGEGGDIKVNYGKLNSPGKHPMMVNALSKFPPQFFFNGNNGVSGSRSFRADTSLEGEGDKRNPFTTFPPALNYLRQPLPPEPCEKLLWEDEIISLEDEPTTNNNNFVIDKFVFNEFSLPSTILNGSCRSRNHSYTNKLQPSSNVRNSCEIAKNQSNNNNKVSLTKAANFEEEKMFPATPKFRRGNRRLFWREKRNNDRNYYTIVRIDDDRNAFNSFLKVVISHRSLHNCRLTLALLARVMGAEPSRMRAGVIRSMFKHLQCFRVLGPLFLQIKNTISPYWNQPSSLKYLAGIGLSKAFLAYRSNSQRDDISGRRPFSTRTPTHERPLYLSQTFALPKPLLQYLTYAELDRDDTQNNNPYKNLN